MNPKVALAAAAALTMFAIAQTSSTAHNEMPGLRTSLGASSEQVEGPAITSAKKKPAKPTAKLLKKEKGIKDQYVVIFSDEIAGGRGDQSNSENLAHALIGTYGGKLRHTYKYAINGFAARMTEAQATAMSEDTLVEYVEQDVEIKAAAVQTGAVWGLDRVDQRPRALNGTYSYTYSGAGVNAYVIDSGIMTNHTQFGGRAAWAIDYVPDGRQGQDCYGHGTHVAGTVGGATYGVAKSVTLWSVRVLDCAGNGTASTAAAAVDWLTRNARRPAVVNMSLGWPEFLTLDQALVNSFNAGVTYVVAAGNNSANACNYSPAGSAGAITVGATDGADRRASFSNFGGCVDVFAPGVGIMSASHTTTTASKLSDGTSMASPHVAGAAAIYLSAYPYATPTQVRTVILNTATTYLLSGIGSGSPNRLLYSLLTY